MNRATATRCLQALGRRIARAWRMHRLQVRITQLVMLRARPDLWEYTDPLQRDLLEARLAELRCELNVLEMQA